MHNSVGCSNITKKGGARWERNVSIVVQQVTAQQAFLAILTDAMNTREWIQNIAYFAALRAMAPQPYPVIQTSATNMAVMACIAFIAARQVRVAQASRAIPTNAMKDNLLWRLR